MSQEPTVEAIAADREIQQAELSSTLDSLAAMVRVLRRIGGYLEHVDQLELRAAEAKLARHGRAVDR